jgi:hypothetical protein
MCRYDDASGLLLKDLRFVEDGSVFVMTFEKRKNAQYGQGNKVLVSSCPLAIVCPVRLLNQLRTYTEHRRSYTSSGVSTAAWWLRTREGRSRDR